jgi:hypothetical protein
VHERTLDPGLRVSAIGQGCMGTSQTYGPNPGDRDTMTAVLRGAVNARVQGKPVRRPSHGSNGLLNVVEVPLAKPLSDASGTQAGR